MLASARLGNVEGVGGSPAAGLAGSLQHPTAPSSDPPTPPPHPQLCSTDLARYLDARGGAPLHERSAAFIVLQLLSALAACHHAGVAFRDVKPANLLVRGIDANGLPEICLADFGCARPTGSGRSSAGTPLYSAPECIDGVGGIESDGEGGGTWVWEGDERPSASPSCWSAQ